MKKKLDLPEALQKRVSGKKVAAVLDVDIARVTLENLMVLDDLGADFVTDVPAIENDMGISFPVKEPAITIEQMEGNILESPPTEDKDTQKAKRRPIDTGKVKALRKAGWSLQKIADEMGCSMQNISRILIRENENEQKEESMP